MEDNGGQDPQITENPPPSPIAIGFVDRMRQAQEKFPLVPEDAIREMQLTGRIAVLTTAISAQDGLMGIAENIHADTPDLEDQLRTGLFTGAAASLTDCVLGYPDATNFDQRDDQVWIDHFGRQETYLHTLYKDRQKIDSGIYRDDMAEALKLINAIEYILHLEKSRKPSNDYIELIAKMRTKFNCGLPDIPVDRSFFDARFAIEKDYIIDAVEANEASHGRKDLTHANSPSYDFDPQSDDQKPQ